MKRVTKKRKMTHARNDMIVSSLTFAHSQIPSLKKANILFIPDSHSLPGVTIPANHHTGTHHDSPRCNFREMLRRNVMMMRRRKSEGKKAGGGGKRRKRR